MASFAVLARNALSNWAIFAANMVVTLVLSPLVVKELGSAQYGIWIFISTVTGYLGLIEAGVTVSTGRFLNHHIGRGDRAAAEATISVALVFYGAASAVLLLLVAALAIPIRALATPGLGIDGARLHAIVMLLTANVAGMFVGAVYSQLLQAANRFDLKNLALLASLVFRFIATLLVLRAGGGLYELAWIQLGSTLIATGAMVLAANLRGPEVSVRLAGFSRSALVELIGFGKWAFASNVTSRIDWQGGVVVTGVYLNAKAVAHFSVAQMLVEYGVQLVQNVVTVAGPDLTKKAAQGDLAALERFVDHGGRVAALFGAPLMAGVAVYGPDFVRLWMGHEFAAAAWVMVILAVAKSCFLIATSLGMAIWAVGHIRLYTTVYLAVAMLGILLAVALLSYGLLGIEAVALSALVVSVLQWMIVLPCIGARAIGLAVARFYRMVVLRYLAAVLAFVVPAMALHHWWPPHSWPTFAGTTFLAVLLYLPLAACVLWGPRQSWRVVSSRSAALTARYAGGRR